MKNYEEMSDFEINSAVHNALLGKPYELTFNGDGKITWKDKERGGVWETGIVQYTKNGLHDYCNNPSDAWPIIVDIKISLTCHQSRGEWSAVFNTENICFHANNPLRAAMIVFLKMNEDKL